MYKKGKFTFSLIFIKTLFTNSALHNIIFVLMKILYAVQGTGNGHVSRAREIIPLLLRLGTVDVAISGTECEVDLPVEPRYRFDGLGFIFGKKGGIDFWATWKSYNLRNFIRDIRRLPVHDYDLVIHDFEPVTAWSCMLKGKKSISLSHQGAYLSPKVPKLRGLHWGKFLMDHYAPATVSLAFHFKKYDDYIYHPVIRKEVRDLTVQDLGYWTVYLPAYEDQFLITLLSKFPEERWQIFSKRCKKSYRLGSISVHPIQSEAYTHSLANCTGLLTGGGFEGPAEALYLQKKLIAVPMKHQYEQQCNALALEQMGVPVIWHDQDFEPKIRAWLYGTVGQKVTVEYEDQTEHILKNIYTIHRQFMNLA